MNNELISADGYGIEEEVNDAISRHNMISLENYSTVLNKWIVSRFIYMLGSGLLSDGEYTVMQKIYEKLCDEVKTPEVREILKLDFISEYLSRTYEDDPVPYEQFSALGIDEETESNIVNAYFESKRPLNSNNDLDLTISEKIQDMIEEDPPKSIRPVESIIECYNWFEKVKGMDLCASLKIDGINLRMFYIDGHLRHCCTRGRAGNTIDYTQVMSNIVPKYLEFDGKPFTGKVRGEAYTQPDKLEYLRNKYPADYVVPRTAAKTMLSVPHSPEDMKYLRFISFNNDVSEPLFSKLDRFGDKGFDIVPKKIIRYEGGTIEEFTDWISGILSEFSRLEVENNLKCDGLVVELNNPSDFEKLKSDTNYDEGNLALKIGPWEPEVYEAKVKEIVMYREKDALQFNCKAIIEPVIVSSGITLSVVNMFNLGLVQKYGVEPGSTIKFIFKNDNASQWVYEDFVLRMKTQLGS